jgi:hypothetical protein
MRSLYHRLAVFSRGRDAVREAHQGLLERREERGGTLSSLLSAHAPEHIMTTDPFWSAALRVPDRLDLRRTTRQGPRLVTGWGSGDR